MSELSASQRGIVTPDQPANPERRAFLRRAGETAVAAGAAAVATNLWLPHAARAAAINPEQPSLETHDAIRPPELSTPLTAEQRIVVARKKLAEAEKLHPSRLPDISVEAQTEGGTIFVKPGTVVFNQATSEKVLRARFDDGWDEALVYEGFGTFAELGVKVNVYAVGLSIQAYPNAYRQADATKLIEWHNHTWDHSDLTPFSRDEIIDNQVMPQSNVLRSVLRKDVEEFSLGTPYGSGTELGQAPDSQIVNTAKRLKMALAMWNKDGMGWNNATVDQIMSVLLPIKPGDHPIFHFLRNDIDAFRLYVAEAKRQGYRFEWLSQMPHAKNMGF